MVATYTAGKAVNQESKPGQLYVKVRGLISFRY
jgi:hypothetical protein